MMGVLGAFVFAAQMINFSIPGTGSSGHITGGILLAALLGPWAAFAVLCGVLLIQCLLFADGGIMALGCNILNMAALSTLVAYPLLFRPFNRGIDNGTARIFTLSIIASSGSALLGAAAVTMETGLSGITLLPTAEFLSFMLPIHAIIGLCEGVATGAVLCAVKRHRPDMLQHTLDRQSPLLGPLTIFSLVAMLMGGVLSLMASTRPDGLEWSIMRVAGEEPTASGTLHHIAQSMQQTTALMPDYNTSWAGIAGSSAIIAIALLAAGVFRRRADNR